MFWFINTAYKQVIILCDASTGHQVPSNSITRRARCTIPECNSLLHCISGIALHTWALLRWWFTIRRGAISSVWTFTFTFTTRSADARELISSQTPCTFRNKVWLFSRVLHICVYEVPKRRSFSTAVATPYTSSGVLRVAVNYSQRAFDAVSVD